MNFIKTTAQVLFIAVTLVAPVHAAMNKFKIKENQDMTAQQVLQMFAQQMYRVDKNRARLLQKNTIDFNKSKFFQKLAL